MKRALWLSFLFLAGAAGAQETAPLAKLEAARSLKIEDFPNDNGSAVMATWKVMPYDDKATYKLLVRVGEKGEWMPAGSMDENSQFKPEMSGGEGFTADLRNDLPWWAWTGKDTVHFLKVDRYSDRGTVKPLLPEEDRFTQVRPATPAYWWKLHVETPGGAWESEPVQVTPRGNPFDWPKLNTFLFMICFSCIVMVVIGVAKRRELWIRRIPGLDAVDEAVGRATEMGKPIFYLTGRDDMTSVSTLAATLILGEIAKKVAAYDTALRVPHTDPIVMAVCQEITRESYISAGRPDSYRPESNFFVTSDQFGYTAAVDGLMVREKPAAVFLMGFYYAESLLLAETGAATGAIQIAGTDADAQLPFFFAACDYTLIGEELYAAGAYLSREPVLVGTLRAQDIGKAILLATIIAITIFATIGQFGGRGARRFASGLVDLVRAF